MYRDAGLPDFQPLLGHGEIERALFALDGADDRFFGRFQARAFGLVLGGGEVESVLIGGDARVSDGLIERGLGLLQRGFLFDQVLLSAAGIEADDGFASLDLAAGRGQPDDLEVRDVDGRVDLNEAIGHQFAAASDEYQEIALVSAGEGHADSFVGAPEFPNGKRRAGRDNQQNRGAQPEFLVALQRDASMSTAAERSGIR